MTALAGVGIRRLAPLTIVVPAPAAVPPTTDDAAWSAAAGRLGIDADVRVARGDHHGRAIADALADAPSDFVLIAPPGTDAARAVAHLDALWRERHHAGIVLGIGPAATNPGRQRPGAGSVVARRALRRILALPVEPVADLIFFRRAALTRLPEADGAYEWMLEALVLGLADGWPVASQTLPAPGAPHPLRRRRLTPRALWRLWVLRNSALSADYDERAFNSVIPLQRYWHRRRHAIINGFVDPRTRILDVGCGSSRIVQDLPRAVGLDVQIKKLRRIAPHTRKVVQATMTRLPFMSASFDTLICSQVIEHVPAPLVDWTEMHRVLVPGGTLVVGTPDYATLAWPLLERLYGLVHPRGYVHEHINRYTAASLRAALEAHGFAVHAEAYVGAGELIVRASKTVRPAHGGDCTAVDDVL